MRRVRLRSLLVVACVAALTHAAPAQEVQPVAALVAPLALPPLEPTRALITALPQVQAARAGVDLAQARGRQLAVGGYEWNLRLGGQERRETAGPVHAESDVAIERSVRWGGKAEADSNLGQATETAGRLAYADTWHESVRGLLKAWYDWQRERGMAMVQARQLAVVQEQLQVASRRVKAGDAPRMDQLMAQAELDRVEASAQQARSREQVQRQELLKRYPGVALSEAAAASSPDQAQLPGEPAAWLQRILADNHEIELAEAEARQARLRSERARLETRPDPLLGVRAARERGGQENVVGVYISIPLAGEYREAQQRASLAEAQAAEQRLMQTRQRVEATAQRTVLQASSALDVWRRLSAVQQAMDRVAQLAGKAYGLGEVTLTEALQARRTALEASQAADAARWDALEGVARVLVDAHQLWAAEEGGH